VAVVRRCGGCGEPGKKNTRMSGSNEPSGFEVDVPVSFFVVALRDSKCKMPRQMGAVCSFGASCL